MAYGHGEIGAVGNGRQDVDATTLRWLETAKYDLELIKSHACQWLSETLQMEIIPQTFLESLDSGVELCTLVEIVQGKIRSALGIETEGDVLDLTLMSLLDLIKYHKAAERGTFFARENTKFFLKWCKKLGVHDQLLFETNDLIEHVNERSVALCILEVSHCVQVVYSWCSEQLPLNGEVSIHQDMSDRKISTQRTDSLKVNEPEIDNKRETAASDLKEAPQVPQTVSRIQGDKMKAKVCMLAGSN